MNEKIKELVLAAGLSSTYERERIQLLVEMVATKCADIAYNKFQGIDAAKQIKEYFGVK